MTSSVEHLSLAHPRGVSRLRVGPGALAECRPELEGWMAGRRVFAVTTPRVWELHGEDLDPFAATAGGWEVLEIEEGEAAKSLETAGWLWRRLLQAGGKRDSRLVAFGGGSVGDLTGFVASCFLRGVGFAQLPTTVLAQVDASVGGKTAVDLPEGKNTVGAFHHPDWVVADTRWIETLPAAEVRSGLLEVVKMGFVLDPELFAAVESSLADLLAGAPGAWGPVAARAVDAKRRVVERDPEEAGERRLLNFGHTLGHALEAATGYQGMRHGEAVGWGMRLALRLAQRRGLPEVDAQRLRVLLDQIGLPALPPLDAERLQELMARDKKARETGMAWVLPRRLGEGMVSLDVSPAEVAQALTDLLGKR